MWTDFSRDKNPDCIQVHKNFLVAGRNTGGVVYENEKEKYILPGILEFKFKDVKSISFESDNYYGVVLLQGLYPYIYFTYSTHLENKLVISVYRFLADFENDSGYDRDYLKTLATTGVDWQLNFSSMENYHTLISVQLPRPLIFSRKIEEFTLLFFEDKDKYYLFFKNIRDIHNQLK
jgi:hypothetical protein